MMERENRLPKHKDCRHEYRFLKKCKGYYVYYCIYCLLWNLKDPDEKMGDWIDRLMKEGKLNEST